MWCFLVKWDDGRWKSHDSLELLARFSVTVAVTDENETRERFGGLELLSVCLSINQLIS